MTSVLVTRSVQLTFMLLHFEYYLKSCIFLFTLHIFAKYILIPLTRNKKKLKLTLKIRSYFSSLILLVSTFQYFLRFNFLQVTAKLLKQLIEM